MAKQTSYFDDSSGGFRERLRLLTERMGSANALAKASGVPQSSIRHYLGKGEPTRPVLVALAKAAGVRTGWLADGIGPMGEEEVSAAGETLDENYVRIALYDPQSDASGGSPADRVPAQNPLALEQSWVRNQLHVGSAPLKLLYMEGDSMEPTLRQGDLVLVDRADTRARDGVCLLNMESSLFVKRLQYVSPDAFTVSGDNPTTKPFNIALSNNGAQVRIVGRAIWADRKL